MHGPDVQDPLFSSTSYTKGEKQTTGALGRVECFLESTEHSPQLPRSHPGKRLRPCDFSELPGSGLSAPWPRRERQGQLCRPAHSCAAGISEPELLGPIQTGSLLQYPPPPLPPACNIADQEGDTRTNLKCRFKRDEGGLSSPHCASCPPHPPAPTPQIIRAYQDLWLKLTLGKAVA